MPIITNIVKKFYMIQKEQKYEIKCIIIYECTFVYLEKPVCTKIQTGFFLKIENYSNFLLEEKMCKNCEKHVEKEKYKIL